VRVFQFVSSEDGIPVPGGAVIETDDKPIICTEHQDIVSCMVSCEGRYYSAGYDRKIVVMDIAHHGDLKIKVLKVIKDAHDSAITCMIFGKDADNSWLISGGFDRVVKLWSLDGSLIGRFDGFADTIVSLTYVLPTQTLWISANSSSPVIYDPRSGINVTDHISFDTHAYNPKGSPFSFKSLLYVPETNQIIGVTNRKAVVIWKYNQNAAITVLNGHTDSVQSLTFSMSYFT
jgi:WD40 repeat protein